MSVSDYTSKTKINIFQNIFFTPQSRSEPIYSKKCYFSIWGKHHSFSKLYFVRILAHCEMMVVSNYVLSNSISIEITWCSKDSWLFCWISCHGFFLLDGGFFWSIIPLVGILRELHYVNSSSQLSRALLPRFKFHIWKHVLGRCLKFRQNIFVSNM